MISRNKKIVDIFKKHIPERESVAREDGLRLGYLRGNISGFIYALGLLVSLFSYYYRKESDFSWLTTLTIMPVTAVIITGIMPKEIQKGFNGKMLLFYGTTVVIALFILFVVF